MNGLALLQPRPRKPAAGAIHADSREDEALRRIAAALGRITSQAIGASTDSAGGETDFCARSGRSNLPSYLEEALGRVERLGAEHAGMADELLCVYEQLGIVFEVTRRLHTVRRESEVVDLFIESLARTFQNHDVFYVPAERLARNPEDEAHGRTGVTPASKVEGRKSTIDRERSSDCRTSTSDSPSAQGAGYVPWVMTMVERARETGTVLVEALSHDPPHGAEGGLQADLNAPRSAVGDRKGTGPAECEVRPSTPFRPGSGETVPGATAEVMVAPVFAGGGGRDKVEDSSDPDSFVGAIVLAYACDARRETAGTVRGFRASDMLLLESLATFCGDLIRNHRLVEQLRDMAFVVVRSLVGAVEQKDPYTSGHSLRVGYFATMLGNVLGLDEAELMTLQWGALLHDVGKIGIRDDVLKKQGRLTEEEFRHIQEHPRRSHQMVSGLGGSLAGALDGVLYHHERYDGTGYPSGLSGEQIPLQARIIQIADIFDALTSTRSYRPAFSWSRALAILREEAGKTVDPKLQGIFDGCLRAQVGDAEEGWNKLLRRANAFTQCALLAGVDPLTPKAVNGGRSNGPVGSCRIGSSIRQSPADSPES